jgi:hypothetical protein
VVFWNYADSVVFFVILASSKILFIFIESSFVEQVEEPVICLSLYDFLRSFGVQYKVR